mmetsp:Transcript_28543/g.80674  ORF Transcript_28543/g.80674 Transcript_28543/m.80674 type:complete len:414 (+) Transcript_28543:504-1745(+)
MSVNWPCWCSAEISHLLSAYMMKVTVELRSSSPLKETCFDEDWFFFHLISPNVSMAMSLPPSCTSLTWTSTRTFLTPGGICGGVSSSVTGPSRACCTPEGPSSPLARGNWSRSFSLFWTHSRNFVPPGEGPHSAVNPGEHLMMGNPSLRWSIHTTVESLPSSCTVAPLLDAWLFLPSTMVATLGLSEPAKWRFGGGGVLPISVFSCMAMTCMVSPSRPGPCAWKSCTRTVVLYASFRFVCIRLAAPSSRIRKRSKCSTSSASPSPNSSRKLVPMRAFFDDLSSITWSCGVGSVISRSEDRCTTASVMVDTRSPIRSAIFWEALPSSVARRLCPYMIVTATTSTLPQSSSACMPSYGQSTADMTKYTRFSPRVMATSPSWAITRPSRTRAKTATKRMYDNSSESWTARAPTPPA